MRAIGRSAPAAVRNPAEGSVGDRESLGKPVAGGMRQIRLGVVDDHEVVRNGVAYAIAQRDQPRGERPIWFCSEGADVTSLLSRTPCDVVLLDMFLGDGSEPGANVARLRDWGAEVLVFSVADDPVAVRAALRHGALGVIPKTALAETMMAAVRRAAEGLEVGTALWAPALAGDAHFTSAGLSPREREALKLYAAGLPLKAVAARMGVADTTVKELLSRIRNKYRRADRPAPTKVDLRQRAVEDGILPPTRWSLAEE